MSFYPLVPTDSNTTQLGPRLATLQGKVEKLRAMHAESVYIQLRTFELLSQGFERLAVAQTGSTHTHSTQQTTHNNNSTNVSNISINNALRTQQPVNSNSNSNSLNNFNTLKNHVVYSHPTKKTRINDYYFEDDVNNNVDSVDDAVSAKQLNTNTSTLKKQNEQLQNGGNGVSGSMNDDDVTHSHQQPALTKPSSDQLQNFTLNQFSQWHKQLDSGTYTQQQAITAINPTAFSLLKKANTRGNPNASITDRDCINTNSQISIQMNNKIDAMKKDTYFNTTQRVMDDIIDTEQLVKKLPLPTQFSRPSARVDKELGYSNSNSTSIPPPKPSTNNYLALPGPHTQSNALIPFQHSTQQFQHETNQHMTLLLQSSQFQSQPQPLQNQSSTALYLPYDNAMNATTESPTYSTALVTRSPNSPSKPSVSPHSDDGSIILDTSQYRQNQHQNHYNTPNYTNYQSQSNYNSNYNNSYGYNANYNNYNQYGRNPSSASFGSTKRPNVTTFQVTAQQSLWVIHELYKRFQRQFLDAIRKNRHLMHSYSIRAQRGNSIAGYAQYHSLYNDHFNNNFGGRFLGGYGSDMNHNMLSYGGSASYGSSLSPRFHPTSNALTYSPIFTTNQSQFTSNNSNQYALTYMGSRPTQNQQQFFPHGQGSPHMSGMNASVNTMINSYRALNSPYLDGHSTNTLDSGQFVTIDDKRFLTASPVLHSTAHWGQLNGYPTLSNSDIPSTAVVTADRQDPSFNHPNNVGGYNSGANSPVILRSPMALGYNNNRPDSTSLSFSNPNSKISSELQQQQLHGSSFFLNDVHDIGMGSRNEYNSTNTGNSGALNNLLRTNDDFNIFGHKRGPITTTPTISPVLSAAPGQYSPVMFTQSLFGPNSNTTRSGVSGLPNIILAPNSSVIGNKQSQSNMSMGQSNKGNTNAINRQNPPTNNKPTKTSLHIEEIHDDSPVIQISSNDDHFALIEQPKLTPMMSEFVLPNSTTSTTTNSLPSTTAVATIPVDIPMGYTNGQSHHNHSSAGSAGIYQPGTNGIPVVRITGNFDTMGDDHHNQVGNYSPGFKPTMITANPTTTSNPSVAITDPSNFNLTIATTPLLGIQPMTMALSELNLNKK